MLKNNLILHEICPGFGALNINLKKCRGQVKRFIYLLHIQQTTHASTLSKFMSSLLGSMGEGVLIFMEEGLVGGGELEIHLQGGMGIDSGMGAW
jgi:hypothetical protein